MTYQKLIAKRFLFYEKVFLVVWKKNLSFHLDDLKIIINQEIEFYNLNNIQLIFPVAQKFKIKISWRKIGGELTNGKLSTLLINIQKLLSSI